MTTLKQLNELQSNQARALAQAGRSKRFQERLAIVRTSDKPLMVWMKGSGQYEADLRDYIEGVINEFGPELLRVLELRQEALARKHSAEAAVIRAQLATVVDEEAS